jgi:hypothetical protein
MVASAAAMKTDSLSVLITALVWVIMFVLSFLSFYMFVAGSTLALGPVLCYGV